MRKSASPRAKAARVLGLSNSWSPTRRVTIWAVTVVTASRGFAVRFAASPAAITTIMVSPIARDTASRMLPTIPGSAAGSTTRRTVSDFVAPRPSEPSRSAWGTALITSSDNDDTNGMIITPMTSPAASALWEATSSPRAAPASRTAGATTSAAKNPYTTVGIPARISRSGFAIERSRRLAYSAR